MSCLINDSDADILGHCQHCLHLIIGMPKVAVQSNQLLT